MKKPKIGIAWKLIGSMVGSLVLLFASLTFFYFNHHRDHLETAVIKSAMNINETIKRTIIHNMMNENCAGAFDVIDAIAKDKSIEKIRIFNAEGRIEHTTFPEERLEYLDKKSEQCLGCHVGPEPRSQPDSNHQNWRVFKNETGERILGVTNPIWNEPSCSTASCHYHPEERSVLGVLDVNMSLEIVDDQIVEERNLAFGFFFFSMVVIAVISGTFVYFMVHRPVKRLMHGMRLIASGDLNHSLPERSTDEVGELAVAFNQMTGDLKDAQAEVEQWTDELERRVDEKTEELERAHRQIVRVEKMASLGKLSAIVAHEVNNPLTGVLTYARLLQKKIGRRQNEANGDFGEYLNYLKVIEEETARCGDIVRNLLMFSKKNTVNLEKNNFNELLQKSIKLVNHQLDLSDIKLKTSLADDLPPILCDAGQIQQIFVALLINASEAIGSGGTVEVSSRFDPEREMIEFECSDNGPGMDQDTRQKVFEPFFTTKEDSNGSGLGLAVVYGIVQRHGGTITVRSEPGEGATFAIALPLEPPVQGESFEDIPASAQPDRL